MTSPQKENGYTAIAHEILEQLVKTALLGSELRIILFILRKTYGFQKKEDRISLTQFEKGTGLSRPTVVKTLKNLISRNILVKTALLEIKFNKYWDSWVVNTAKLVKHNDVGSKDRFTKISKHGLTHNRKYIDTIDNTAETSSAGIVSIIETFSKLNPSCKKLYGNTTQRKACQFLIDTYGIERIIAVIEKTLPKTNSLQFFPTITTPLQLQDKWSNLESAIRKYQSEKLLTKEKYKVI